MKKLLLVLLFIPLVSFGQEKNVPPDNMVIIIKVISFIISAVVISVPIILLIVILKKKKVFKKKKPNYRKVISAFVRIVLMDVHFKKLLETIRDSDKTLSGKISEINFFDEIIIEVFLKQKNSGDYINEAENEKYHNIKTTEQKAHLINLMKECLFNLIMNNFKFCNYEGDLESTLKYVKMLEEVGLVNHSLWKIHYLKTEDKKKISSIENKDWVDKSPKKKELLEFEHSINSFLEKMKNPYIKSWYEIVQKRGEGQALIADASLAVKEDDYNYWAEGHLEEYLLRINSEDEGMRLDEQAFLLRIKVFSEIIDRLEVVIKKASDLELNVTKEMASDYHAAVASKLGAEMALKEIT